MRCSERIGDLGAAAPFTRRQFLGALAGAGAALAARPHVRAAEAATRKLVIGHIGVGGRGKSLLGMVLQMPDVAVAAVCDADLRNAREARELAGGAPEVYQDYRRLLERRDIDAVIIAAPDHWHALMTVHACQAGKDVYVEKPLSHNILEGRRMVEAARRHGRIVQTGMNHRSADYQRQVAEIVRSGRLGTVKRVKTWMWENPVEPPLPDQEPPPELDWDLWLGPAPKVPFNPRRAPFNFRWFRDYAGGYMTDWGAHMMNVVTWAMDADLTGPVSVEGSWKMSPEPNAYEFPAEMEVRWEFKQPEFTLTWHQPRRPDDEIGERHGIVFYGTDALLAFYFTEWHVLKDGEPVEVAPIGSKPGDVELFRSPGHLQNWVDCIRSRALPIADVEIGHHTVAICHLGNVAAMAGARLEWDWRRERITNREVSNLFLERTYRAPWSL